MKELLPLAQWPEPMRGNAARPFKRVFIEYDPATSRYHVPARGVAGARLPPGRLAAFEEVAPGRYRLRLSTGAASLKVTQRGTRTVVYKP